MMTPTVRHTLLVLSLILALLLQSVASGMAAAPPSLEPRAITSLEAESADQQQGGDPATPAYRELATMMAGAEAEVGTLSHPPYYGWSGLSPYTLYNTYAKDEVFIADRGGDLDQYLFRSRSPLTFDLPITRHYGEVDGNGYLLYPYSMAAKGLLPSHATLFIRVYDVDHDYQGSDVAPEVDTLHVNDCRLYPNLTSGNNVWSTLTYRVPIYCLKFPAKGAPGSSPTPAQNRISIDIDVANSGDDVWAIEVDWAAIAIQAVRPAVLVNGILSDADGAWGTFRNFPTVRLLPTHGISVGGWSSIETNTNTLLAEIPKAKQMFGVERINIIAHSKGGLDSRSYLRQQQDVDALVQLGTPNRGSECATIIAGYLAPMTRNLRPDWIFKNFNYREVNGFWVLNTPEMHAAPIYIYAGTKFTDRFCSGYLGAINVRLDPPHDGVVSADRATLPWNWAGTDGDGLDQGTVNGRKAVDHSGVHDDEQIAEQAIAWLVANGPGASSAGANAMTMGATAAAAVPAPPVSAAEAPEMAVIDAKVGELAAGETATLAVPVSGAGPARFQIAYTDGSPALELIRPDGQVITPANAASQGAVYGTAQGLLYVAGYDVAEPQAGTWTLRATAAGTVHLYELAAGEVGGPNLTVALSLDQAAPNQAVTVTSTLADSVGAAVTGATVEATLVDPEGLETVITLADAGDGTYTGMLSGAEDGYYAVLVRADWAGSRRLAAAEFAVGGASGQLLSYTGDQPQDTNGDGMAEWLQADVAVNLSEPGEYHLVGVLADSAGNEIQMALGVLQAGAPGIHQMRLSFDGARIYAHGVNGPYQVKDLTLSRADGIPLGSLAGPFLTAAYDYRSFQHALIRLLPEGADQGTDTDGNGLFNRLDIIVGLASDVTGWHLITARLMTGDGREVDWVEGYLYLYPGENWFILPFDGRMVRRSGYNGSFVLTDLTVQSNVAGLVATDVYQTGYYQYQSFELIPTDLYLLPEDVQFTPNPVHTGQTASITATIRNPGYAAGAFGVDFFLGNPAAGGTLIQSVTVPSIGADSTAQAQAAWAVPDEAGSYLICLRVNAARSVPEYDYSNNELCVEVAATEQEPGGPDDTPPVITLDPLAERYLRNQPITIAWTATDDQGIASTSATLNGAPVQNGAVLTPPAGSYELIVQAADLAGNITVSTAAFTVYNVVAVTGDLSGAPRLIRPGEPLVVRFAATDVGGHPVVDPSAEVLLRKGNDEWRFQYGAGTNPIRLVEGYYELVVDLAALGFGLRDSGRVEIYFGGLRHTTVQFQYR